MKTATNIPQQTLTKTLKILEQRNLVKFVRAVTSKSKKLYMLYDLVPAKDITGGPWYTDQVNLPMLSLKIQRNSTTNLSRN
jgi:DNA-directed RNA polymerase III subunit RPC6